jgi:hypothetical protein
MKSVPLENVSWIHDVSSSNDELQVVTPPAFYVGELTLPSNNTPMDTYLDLTGWGKVRRASYTVIDILVYGTLFDINNYIFTALFRA